MPAEAIHDDLLFIENAVKATTLSSDAFLSDMRFLYTGGFRLKTRALPMCF